MTWAALLRMLLATASAAGVLGAAACAGRAVPGAPAPDPCALSVGEATTPDTVEVALGAPFDPSRLGAPADPVERTIVANVYETLVRVDCTGGVRPLLAATWDASADSTAWTFRLRPGARFHGGDAVRARDVPGAWSARTPASTAASSPRARITSVEALGEDRLVVRLDRPSGPSLFADPALAVRRAVPGKVWPEGTGPYAFDERAAPVRGAYREVTLNRMAADAMPRALRFTLPRRADARDALDAGADVVLTRDPEVLAYAAALGLPTPAPLPWDRTYVLFAPAADGAARPPSAALGALARDAVRVSARPAPACANAGGTTGGTPPGRVAARLVHDRSDPAARDLAQRLAVLAGEAGTWPADLLRARRPVVAPVDAAELAVRLGTGTDAGYVVALDGAACDVDGLRGRAHWLASQGAVVTLVQTRAHAIVRGSAGAVTIDGSGALRFGADDGAGSR